MIAARFRATALEHGFLLLSPKCPRDRGCSTGSYWRWDADPAWLTELVDDLAAHHPLDRTRVFLVGWSGGSSYLGHVGQKLRGFTALALMGGGMAPTDAKPCATCPLPVYFLEGDRNPLHSLAIESRDSFKACGSLVEWDLLPGRDHGGELSAVAPAKIATMLDWMTAHRADCPIAPSSDAGALPLPASSARTGRATTDAVPSAQPVPPAGRGSSRACGCEVRAPRDTNVMMALSAGLLALARFRLRSRRAR